MPKDDRAGFSLVELLTVVAVAGILSVIGVPSLLRARMAANESSAIGAMRTIHSGQHAFWNSCGAGHYAVSLQVLATQRFVPEDLNGSPARKSGYTFSMGSANTVEGSSCAGSPWATTYQATADPAWPGSTGVRFFGVNATGTLFQAAASLAGTMPEAGAPASGRPVS